MSRPEVTHSEYFDLVHASAYLLARRPEFLQQEKSTEVLMSRTARNYFVNAPIVFFRYTTRPDRADHDFLSARFGYATFHPRVSNLSGLKFFARRRRTDVEIRSAVVLSFCLPPKIVP